MNTTLHISIDHETKAAAQKLAKEMGLDLTTIVKASLKTFVRNRAFHAEFGPRMTPYLERIVAQARVDLAANKNVSPAFTNAGAAMRWLKQNAK